MDENLTDGAAGGELYAALSGQYFLAVIVARLVGRGALTTLDISDALGSERKVIEDLRAQGDDARLLAIASDNFVGVLERCIASAGSKLLPVAEWRIDPADPLWPLLPDNDH